MFLVSGIEMFVDLNGGFVIVDVVDCEVFIVVLVVVGFDIEVLCLGLMVCGGDVGMVGVVVVDVGIVLSIFV